MRRAAAAQVWAERAARRARSKVEDLPLHAHGHHARYDYRRHLYRGHPYRVHDFAVLSGLLFLNGFIGFWEAARAGDAVAALKASLKPEAQVDLMASGVRWMPASSSRAIVSR